MYKAHSALARVYKVFVVDDHPLIRRGYRMLLENEPDLILCGEAADGLEAAEKMLGAADPPDLVITDISMEGMNGLELAAYLHELWPELSILVSSTYEPEHYRRRVQEAGGGGYIQKADVIDHGLDAIRCMLTKEPCQQCPYVFTTMHPV